MLFELFCCIFFSCFKLLVFIFLMLLFYLYSSELTWITYD